LPREWCTEKNWPDASFRVVVDWWRRACGAVVVILGPVEEEKGDYTALCEGAVVARSLSLGKLAALLVRSDLYLGNDSGVSHLAAALGVATTVLFGPSNVGRWAPARQECNRSDSERRLCAMFGLDDEKVPASEVSDHTRARICNHKTGRVGGAAHLAKGGGRDYSKF
jgi:ADP-heptose:LPS heptosyltransferase